MSYTPWVSGEYDVFVQANGVDILDSPFALTVAIGDVKAGASTSVGDGLVGGIAGDILPLKFRQRTNANTKSRQFLSIQIMSQSISEVQTITCDGSNTPTTDSFELTFRGETVTINGNMIGSDIKDALEGLDAIPSVDVTIAGGATACASSNPPDIEITFTGLDGDVPEFIVSSKSGPDSVQVIQSVMGVTPAVKEVQYFTCQGTTGTVTLDFTSIENVYGATFGHGTGSVTIDAADTYNDLQATLDAVFGSGTITVSRPDGGSLSCPKVCTNGASRDVHLTFRSGTGDVSEAWLTPSSHTLQRSNGNSGSFTSGERVQGVSAAWGNFVVSFEGKSTSPIDARAPAAAVEAALELLDGIGDVSVTQSAVGRDAFGEAVAYAWNVRFDPAWSSIKRRTTTPPRLRTCCVISSMEERRPISSPNYRLARCRWSRRQQ